jgi:hypothetical protein
MPSDLIRGWTPVRVKKTRQKQDDDSAGNIRDHQPFSRHGNKTRNLSVMYRDGGLRWGFRTGPAWSGYSPGPDRAAITTISCQLRPDATGTGLDDGHARRNHHRQGV